MYYHSPLAVTE